MPSLIRLNNAVANKLRGLKNDAVARAEGEKEKSDLSKNERKRREKAAKKEERKKEHGEDEDKKSLLDDKVVGEVVKPGGSSSTTVVDEEEEEDSSSDRYGKLVGKIDIPTDTRHIPINAIDPTAHQGQRVFFRARVHYERPQSSRLEFYLFRHLGATIQGVLVASPPDVSERMVRWAERLPKESIVLVQGVLQRPPAPVRSATVKEVEVKVERIYLVSRAGHLPFNLIDAQRPATDFEDEELRASKVENHTRLENRVFDLRNLTNQAIFRINAGVCRFFRSHLDSLDFIEIHSPKLQASATESGASVFKVSYFSRTAFLAQSPQLAKQMCISADMERVYEVGPVFRAENSNTHRHLTEYTGLDLEMALTCAGGDGEDYHEGLNVIDGMFVAVFEGLEREYRKQIEVVREQFPSTDFVYKVTTGEGGERTEAGSLRLTFMEAVKMLREAGREQEEDEDLDTPTEKFLGKLVKEKYGTDYYILDKFPTSARPFYTMPDSKDGRFSNSFDIFMRGEEILSGGQRIHDVDMLVNNLKESGIDPDDLKEYVDGFRLGVPPHAGGGIGLERVVMLYLSLGNVRWASLFPRDPKSLPEREKGMVLKTTGKVESGKYKESKFGHRISVEGE